MIEKKKILTREGYERLEKERQDSIGRRRKEVAEKIREAREQGDLSENAAYKSAKEEQGFIERRIDELTDILRGAKIIDWQKGCKEVGLGCTVRVRFDGQTQTFQLVGEGEADPMRGKISYKSPLGKSLLGRTSGEEFEVKAPRGSLMYRIEEIK